MVYVAAAILLASIATSYMAGQGTTRRQSSELKRINGIVDGIVQQINAGYKELKFDQTPLTLEEYQYLQDYVPELATYIEEKAPKVVAEAQSQTEIQTQKDVLQRARQQMVEGDDAIAKAARENAKGESMALEQSMRKQALSQLAQQGMLSGADRITAEMSAVQNAGQNARQASLQAASEQETRRRQSMGMAADLAGNIRNQNMTKERSNVDIMNSFNQRAAQRRQQYLESIASQRNQAQQRNLSVRQDINNSNTALRNSMQTYEQDRRDQYERDRVNNSNNRLEMITAAEKARIGIASPGAGGLERALGVGGGALTETGVKMFTNSLADTKPAATPGTPAPALTNTYQQPYIDNSDEELEYTTPRGRTK